MGIIHMNGRVYDPELGRFLSADPFIQDPYNTQSFNRYSYCMNNPFKYTDPSGYSWEDNNGGVDSSGSTPSAPGGYESTEISNAPGGGDGGGEITNTTVETKRRDGIRRWTNRNARFYNKNGEINYEAEINRLNNLIDANDKRIGDINNYISYVKRLDDLVKRNNYYKFSYILGFGIRINFGPIGIDFGAYISNGYSQIKGYSRFSLKGYFSTHPAIGYSIGKGPFGGIWSGPQETLTKANEIGVDGPLCVSGLKDNMGHKGVIVGGPTIGGLSGFVRGNNTELEYSKPVGHDIMTNINTDYSGLF
jgi:hypothetical protein